MFSWVQRANALLFHTLTVLFLLSVACAVTTLWHTDNPSVTLDVHPVKRLRQVLHGGVRSEEAPMKFDVTGNLSSVFNWNVKQLFVWIEAKYATETNPVNQIILWDHIIKTKEDAVFTLPNLVGKYRLIDQGMGLQGNELMFTLRWNIMPIVGVLRVQHQAVATRVTLPLDLIQ